MVGIAVIAIRNVVGMAEAKRVKELMRKNTHDI